MKNKIEKIKDSFSFLKTHEYFACTYEEEDCLKFFYDTKIISSDDFQYEGCIVISSSYEVGWELVEECSEYEKKYKMLQATPDWFLMLYEQTMIKINEQTRLRDLFDPSKTKKIGIDEFFDELSNSLEKK